MKKPVSYEQISAENKERFIKALPYIAGSRKPRSKPRCQEESTGLAIATAETVRNAFKTGKIVRKSPKGFILK
jgi:hypothetical protein